MKTIRVLGLTLFIFLLYALPAQAGITPRGMGMGYAYVASARGVHAPMMNPALLGLPDNPDFSMTFVSLALGAHNNSFSKKDYDHYLVDDPNWDQEDIETILSRIPKDGLKLHAMGTGRVLSFSLGRFAWIFGLDLGSYAASDKDLFSLALKGNQLYKAVILDDGAGEGTGIGLAGMSYGHPIPVSFADHFAVGMSVQFLYGIRYSRIEQAKAHFNTLPFGYRLDGDYKISQSTGHPGFNLDIGAAAQMDGQWTLSLALLNVAGSTSWSPDETTIGFVRGDSLSVFEIIDRQDEAIMDSSWTIKGGQKFSHKIPTVLRTGVAYHMKKILLAFDYLQGFSRDALVTTTPQFSAGAEWSALPWLPLRAGLVAGGKTGFGTCVGFGIRPKGFIFDLGLMNGGFLIPANAKGLGLGVELGMMLD